MRFVQFEWKNRRSVGVELKDGGDIVDLTDSDPSVPHDLVNLIKGGQPMLVAAKRYVRNCNIATTQTLSHAASSRRCNDLYVYWLGKFTGVWTDSCVACTR